MDFRALLETDFFKDVVESGKDESGAFGTAAMRDGIEYPPSASNSSLLPMALPTNGDNCVSSSLADVALPSNDRTSRAITATDVNAMRAVGPKKRVLATSPEPPQTTQSCSEYTGHISNQTGHASDVQTEFHGEPLESVSAEIARAFLTSSTLASQEQFVTHGSYTQSSENVGGACGGTPIPSTHFEESVFSFIQDMQDRVSQMEIMKHNMQTLVNEWSIALEAHNEMLRNFQEFAARNVPMPYSQMPWMQFDAVPYAEAHHNQMHRPSSYSPEYVPLQKKGGPHSHEDPHMAQNLHAMHESADALSWQQTQDWQQVPVADTRTPSSSRCVDVADQLQNAEHNSRAALRGRNPGSGIQPSLRPLARYQRPGGITVRTQTMNAQSHAAVESESTPAPAHTAAAKPSVRRIPAVAVDDREELEQGRHTTSRPSVRRPTVWVEDELDLAPATHDSSDVQFFVSVELRSGEVKKFSHTSFLEPGVSVIVEDDAGSACGLVVHCYEVSPSNNKRILRSEGDSNRGKGAVDGTHLEWSGRKVIGVSSKQKGSASSHPVGNYSATRSTQGYDRSKH